MTKTTDRNIKYDAEWTSRIMIAAYLGDLDAVKLLVDEGGDINNVSCTMWTPLDNAHRGGNKDIVAFLKKRGAKHSHSYKTENHIK